jgi:hypothetical protein
MSAATARDIAIILLALESLIIGGLLIVLILQIRNLIRVLRDEVKPILDEAHETMSTVKGTTSFVSDAVVTPIVNLASFTAAVREGASALRRSRRQDKSEGHTKETASDGK